MSRARMIRQTRYVMVDPVGYLMADGIFKNEGRTHDPRCAKQWGSTAAHELWLSALPPGRRAIVELGGWVLAALNQEVVPLRDATDVA